jgi:signal transduction histidine kinase
VLVRVRRSETGLLLQVVDDGCGIPRDVSKRGRGRRRFRSSRSVSLLGRHGSPKDSRSQRH